jgi:protein phosphatase 2C
MSRDISLHKTSLCGCRPSNEDVEKYNLNLSASGQAINPHFAPIDFLVIADGHGGSAVSEFVVPSLEKCFMNKRMLYPVPYQTIEKIYDGIQQKLIEHPQHIAQNCGCTALVVIRYIDNYFHKYVQVINLGDCRAVLSRNGLAIPLCKDHKPFWSDEKKRIDAVNKKYRTNKQVHFDAEDWRIGDLSVSRAFGDLDNTPHVIHRPESFCHQLLADDEFIVVSCDGVCDVLENHEIVNFVRDHLHNNHIELYNIPNKYPVYELFNEKNIARKLAEFAIAKGSTDNVSVLIIFFDKKNIY